MLFTYDLRIRNTDPRFQLVSCYEKHFRSQMNTAVLYKRVLAVFRTRMALLLLFMDFVKYMDRIQIKPHRN